ncbi:MAG: ABC transporter ATP-binding protein [Synergistaceae bacterium]|jgi:simple sugar transport system ATP-binding protein|nr:ABC transporter ATP-binding protein [Synergistaceae bacterium]
MDELAYVELKGIVKTFGALRANDGVDFRVNRGEIHALLGENGSGKTTLMNILTGLYRQDAGDVFVDGRRVFFRTPKDAIDSGIGMIHQHANLVDALSVEENIAAGTERTFWIDKKKLRVRISEIAESYRMLARPAAKIYSLSVGEKQAVEILKAFYRGVTTLVLDEPTSVLTPSEADALFLNLRRMRECGHAIVLITHKLNEVFDISDRVTVLRKGNSIFTSPIGATNRTELTEKMVGRAISLNIPRTAAPPARETSRPPLLDICEIVAGDGRGRFLDRVSLQVESGEIHGIAGVAGSGQRELCDAIAGLTLVTSGSVRLNGRDIRGMGPGRQRAYGVKIGYVPEDRMEMGLAGDMSISGNVMLRDFLTGLTGSNGPGKIFFNADEADALADRIIKKYDISAPGPAEPVKNLSGGNIQKVLLGREIERRPDLLITAYPVRGLDIGASTYIFELLNREKENGVGILFIGEDLDILLGLCDRVSVMRSHKLVATLDARTAAKTEIGALMAGHSGAPAL